METPNVTPSKLLDSSPDGCFFAVALPSDSESLNPETLVFRDKNEALKLVKLHKVARFKAFRTFSEALDFVVSYKTAFPQLNNGSSSLAAEKPSQFSAPKPKDFIKLRGFIEKGDIENVKKIIEENPRHLISSGDTPSILQEGARYNGLHVASKAGHSNIVSFLLTTVSSLSFVKKLYGHNDTFDSQSLLERCSIFLDLYLNTPDKSCNETPLHFASKFGSLEVVKVLVSYPQCLKNSKNKFGRTPIEMVCSRSAAGTGSELAAAIRTVLSEQYYIPVLGSEDQTVQPIVGDIFTPNKPPTMQHNKMSPLTVMAVAGPMPEKAAVSFRRHWKTPPWKTSPCKTPPSNRFTLTPAEKSMGKGLEKIGRELAREHGVPWKEYWPFLDSFVDLASAEGLSMFESYLKSRFQISTSTNQNAFCVSPTTEPARSLLSESSPIQQLSKSLSALTLQTPVRKENSVGYDQMEKYCEVYAKRISESLVRGVNHYKNEVKNFQNFLRSCSTDSRFGNINLMKSHARIPYLLYNRLSMHSESPKNRLTYIVNELECDTKNEGLVSNVTVAALCIITRTKTVIDNNSSVDVPTWEELEACTCHFPTEKKPTRKLSYFSPRRDYATDSERISIRASPSTPDGPSPQYIEECDSPVSEEFITPPSSPTLNRSSDDEIYEMPQSYLPEVYVIGDHPTYQDAAALDVIESLKLSSEDYPYIYQWKNQCVNFRRISPNSWPTHNNYRLPSSQTSTPSLGECLTPVWNRSPACSSMFDCIYSPPFPKHL